MSLNDPTKPYTPEQRRHREMLERRRLKLERQDKTKETKRKK